MMNIMMDVEGGIKMCMYPDQWCYNCPNKDECKEVEE